MPTGRCMIVWNVPQTHLLFESVTVSNDILPIGVTHRRTRLLHALIGLGSGYSERTAAFSVYAFAQRAVQRSPLSQSKKYA